MAAIPGSNSKLENVFRKALFSKGIRYRKNVADLPGKPDIAIKRKKIAVFLDSCFWHGCKKHCRIPQSNTAYWQGKINKNILRDRDVSLEYKKMGWRIIRLWEHDISRNSEECQSIVLDANFTN